jgi:hypothetical protein
VISTFAFNFNLRRYNAVMTADFIRAARVQPGRAVQVEPMKPMLKAPGAKRLKL